MTTWGNQTKTSIDDCLAELWMQWSQQATELQTLRADAENRKKVGDNFYKMDEESIVTIREELSDDFFSLAESHLGVVWRLVERLDDDRLETQLQFERYEREHWKKEAGKRATTITINDEEQQEEGPTEDKDEHQPKETGVEQTKATEEEQPADTDTESESRSSNNNKMRRCSAPWRKAF